MPRYESARYDPPAPVAEVGLRRAGDPGPPPVTGVRLLIDTGADVTLLPRAALAPLGLQPQPGDRYELIGFDGTRTTADAVELEMVFANKAFRGRYLLADADRGILGRDVLNALALLCDGPKQEWSVV